MTDRTIEEEIADVYRRYVDAFNTGEGAAIAKVMAYPVMVGGANHPPSTIADEAGYAAMIENALAEFRKIGWARSQVDRVEAVATADDTGVISAWFSRWHVDGSKIEDGHGHYIATKRLGEWKIFAAIVS